MSAEEILQEKFTFPLRKGYVFYKNITLSQQFSDFKDSIDNFKVYDDDIWICSFPKTGTTWCQEMIWLIANDLNYEGAKVNQLFRFPFFDLSLVFDFKHWNNNLGSLEVPEHMEDSIKYTSLAARPRFIKSHLPWELLPRQIRLKEKQPKIFYTVRDPRDVCVSYFHHCKAIEGFSGTFHEFLNLFLDGKVPFGGFWENLKGFWTGQENGSVLIIKYEDMKTNLKATLLQIAKFLGKPEIQRDEMEQLINYLSFESMKQNNAVNHSITWSFLKMCGVVDENAADFMRSGKKEAYKLEMNAEDLQRFNSWISKHDPEDELGYSNK